MSHNLNSKYHVKELTNKLATAIYAVRRMREIGTYEAAKVAYFSLFHARAVYRILLLWGHTPDAQQVFLKQKEAIRVVCVVSYRTSCRELFREHNILTLPSAYILAC